MKKTFIKSLCGLILIAAFSFALSGCQKQQHEDLNLTRDQTEANAILLSSGAVSSCGTIPDTIKVPAGNKLVLQAYAAGVQIYQVKRSIVDTNVYSWVNIAPSATLYAKPDYTNQIALHYAGPTWEFTRSLYKDEKVVGKKEKGVTVDPTAIQWLLLKAVDSLSSPGNKVSYIQRICTTGGLPPATPANAENVGKLDSISYTATYLFYTKN